MTHAYIAAACRSPVAPKGGALSALSLHDLATPVVNALLARAGLHARDVDEIIVSNALGAGGNPARHVALAAKLPDRVAGLSIDRQCAGGLDAVALGRMMVLSGGAQVVICGGVESYSRRPIRLVTHPDGSPPTPYTQAPFTPWPDRDPDMAQAAADLAAIMHITKAEQDAWAIHSHAKARALTPSPDEVIPVNGLPKDSFTRDLTQAHCARAKPVVASITAANAAVSADAAAFCLVVSAPIARRLKTQTARILATATRGAAPEQPGLSPLPAIAAACADAQLTTGQLDTAEVMEAYAVQAIACVQGADIDPNIVNTGGGALARGHPVGASGAVNAVRLFHTLRARGGGTGLATIAGAGGVGSALILQAG